MSIPAVCSACGHRFQAPEQFAGKKVKCKHCGTIFTIAGPDEALTAPTADVENPNDRAGLADDELESLAKIEETGSPLRPGAAKHPSASAAGRIGPRNETRMAANPDAGDISLSGPAEPMARANILRFRYPGARIVDQWLSLFLLIGGLLWLVIVGVSPRHDNPQDIAWIKATRLCILVLLYWAIIFQITLAMIRKAAREMRYRMPPGPRMRVFAAYLTPFVLGTVLWIVGEGNITGLVLGVLFGLVLASIFLWLLFRLREDEIPTSVAYGAGGFVLGFAIAALLLLGLNTVTALAVNSAKAQAKVPSSPFGPMSWIAPPPEPLPPLLRPKHTALAQDNTTNDNTAPATQTAAPASRPAPASPVLSDLQPVVLPGPIDSLLQPLSTSSVIGIVRKESDAATTVSPFDLIGDAPAGDEITLASPLGGAVLSTDGQRIAWIATFPRRAVWINAVGTGRNIAKIDIDPAMSSPMLLGFSSTTQVMLHGSTPDGWVIELLDAAQPRQRRSLKLPPPMGSGNATWAINAAAGRLVLAAKKDTPSLVQFDLTNAQAALPEIPINEIDPSLATSPAGLCYDADASHIAVLFEHAGSAVILVYDAAKATNTAEIDRPAPAGLIPGTSHAAFTGNALISVAPNCWLAYGQGILDDTTGNLLAQLLVDHVTDARLLNGNVIQLLINDPVAPPVTLATLDRSKLANLRHGPATAPAPTAP